GGTLRAAQAVQHTEFSTNDSPGVAYARARIQKYTKVPVFKALPGATPFDAKKLRGKRVFLVSLGNQFPLEKLYIAVDRELLRPYGISFTVYPTQGTPAEWSAGMEQAVSQKYDAIILHGSSPIYFAPAVKRANQAGIPVFDLWGTVKS